MPTPRAPPPCRFFLTSGCYRADCYFSHDAATTACRFASTAGGCKKADCPFFHGAAADADAAPAVDDEAFTDVPAPAAASNAVESLSDSDIAWLLSRATSTTVDDAAAGALDDAFPALPGARRAPAAPARSTPHRSTLAGRLSLEALVRAYPGIPSSELEHCLAEANGSVEAASALVSSRNAMGPVEGALRAPRIGGSLSAMGSSRAGGGRAGIGGMGTPAGAARAREIAAGISRVETGEALASVYAGAREAATALARARNDAFDRATRAYLSSDGATAARFAAQGRALDARMHAEHASAAERIFQERNTHGAAAQGGARVYDLHGLHPHEATSVVDSLLASAAAAASYSDAVWVALLSGARNHSHARGKGGGSLHDALVQHLEAGTVEAYEAAPGVIVVALRC
jgi:hypothetical protein